ncbi:MAG: hypothetical protein WD014_01145 [Dongiaceae bacterium]
MFIDLRARLKLLAAAPEAPARARRAMYQLWEAVQAQAPFLRQSRVAAAAGRQNGIGCACYAVLRFAFRFAVFFFAAFRFGAFFLAAFLAAALAVFLTGFFINCLLVATSSPYR